VVARSGIENNRDPMTRSSPVTPQIFDQFGLVVRVIQPQIGHLPDEIVSINEPVHASL
jgi:hypothetical protein